MKYRRALALCLGLAASLAQAADDPHALAGRLVELLHYDEQFAGYRRQCLQSQEEMSPEVLVAKSPDYFGGLRPGQPQWARVMAAYKVYAQQVCSRPTREEWREVMLAAYASSMTVPQLKSAIQYFSSPAGQALASTSLRVSEAVTTTVSSITAAHVAKATAQYQGELSRIPRGR